MFDASESQDGTSLNDIIYQGPKLQRNLVNVLLRFRRYPVPIVGDISEMYLQIKIKKFDRSIMFGMNTAPLAAETVLESTYMDDTMETEDNAMHLYEELKKF